MDAVNLIGELQDHMLVWTFLFILAYVTRPYICSICYILYTHQKHRIW